MKHALQPLLDAGYTANRNDFTYTSPGFIAEIGVYDTLDARVLIEDNVILKENWKVRDDPDSTKGSRGTYDYKAKYKGTAQAGMSLTIPGLPSAKVWEISADVTFEKGDDI